jgi:hypothetical protein
MNIQISTVMLKLIHDLYATGLFGGSIEDTARILIQERLRQLILDGTLKDK